MFTMAIRKSLRTNLLVALMGGTILLEGGALALQANKHNKAVDQITQESKSKIDKLTVDVSSKEVAIDEIKEKYVSLSKEYEDIKIQNSSLLKENKVLKETPRPTPIKMTLTFYGDFAHENGGYTGIDANGNSLISGTVASNVYPMGTKFVCNGQTFTVRDKGGSNFNSSNRLDVFVPRQQGESDAQYSNRISAYGRKTVMMYKQI